MALHRIQAIELASTHCSVRIYIAVGQYSSVKEKLLLNLQVDGSNLCPCTYEYNFLSYVLTSPQ